MMTNHQMLPGPWRWSNSTTTEWWRSATSGESLGSICMPSVLLVWPNSNSSFVVGTLQIQKSWRRDATCPAATPNEGQLHGSERQDLPYQMPKPECQTRVPTRMKSPNDDPTKMGGKWRMACTFLSDVLIHLHQGLIWSSPNVDVNQTAMEPDVVALKCSALHPLCKCYKGVCDNQTRDERDLEDEDDDDNEWQWNQRLVISWRLVMV